MDSQETLPFGVGISLNSLHASALTCLVSSFKEKASLCVWSVTPWQCPPPRCVWCLLPLPPSTLIRSHLLLLNSERLHHEIWDRELRRTGPVTAAHPFQHSGRALPSKGGLASFLFLLSPFREYVDGSPVLQCPFQRGETLKLHSVPMPIMRVSY